MYLCDRSSCYPKRRLKKQTSAPAVCKSLSLSDPAMTSLPSQDISGDVSWNAAAVVYPLKRVIRPAAAEPSAASASAMPCKSYAQSEPPRRRRGLTRRRLRSRSKAESSWQRDKSGMGWEGRDWGRDHFSADKKLPGAKRSPSRPPSRKRAFPPFFGRPFRCPIVRMSLETAEVCNGISEVEGR